MNDALHGDRQGDRQQRGRQDAEREAVRGDGTVQRGAVEGRRAARRRRPAAELEGCARALRRRRQAHGRRRTVPGDQAAGRRLLAVEGQVEAGGARLGQALPRPDAGRGGRDRDPPGLRGRGFRRRVHVRAARAGEAPARRGRGAKRRLANAFNPGRSPKATPEFGGGEAMHVQPYLFFDGRAEEAINFYRKAIGAEVEMMMRFGESPEKPPPGMVPPGSENKIMHACIRINGADVMASDGNAKGKPKFEGFSLTLNANNEAAADRMFAALADGGQVQMPLGKTFFAKRFGMVADRFGVGWMIIVEA